MTRLLTYLSVILTTITSVLMLSACKGEDGVGGENAMYYWKTEFALTQWERDFLQRNDIRRLYIRFFDISYESQSDGSYQATPIATIRFKDPVPQGIEVVPVVYITNEVMLHEARFDSLLYHRIQAMCQGNGISHVKEIQLDCDWSGKSRDEYFQFCRRMAGHAHRDSLQLSCTIRLHQLRDQVPPVDRGVLMLYNTGALERVETRNSILDYNDVEPYLCNDLTYALPLDMAYPAYNWAAITEDGHYRGLLHSTDFSDGKLYRRVGENLYVVKEGHEREGRWLREGQIIRVEESEMEQIRKTRDAIRSHLSATQRGNILYHLDEANLKPFTEQDIADIFLK